MQYELQTILKSLYTAAKRADLHAMAQASFSLVAEQQ